jgi:glycosyltransferase involved in cell wall biosynthesis
MVPYPAVLHACYRSSRTASLAVTSMLTAHRLLQTWTRKVDTFIALTEFARSKLVAGGLPAEKITVKPNFLPDNVEPGRGEGDFAVYVGRLSKEKGLHTLLRAWKNIPDCPLRILGDGPLRTELHEAVRDLPNVSLAGHCSAEQVRETMRSAKFLVMPSEWYEGFPMTAVEAMAAGTPMIASDLGSLQEVIVEDTGLRFRPGDPADLTRQVRKLLANPEELALLRQRTRRHYEMNFTAERNYLQLIAIYEGAAAIQTKVRI